MSEKDKDNIQVMVRVRPLNEKEKQQQDASCSSGVSSGLMLRNFYSNKKQTQLDDMVD